jgi:hypothetical protein
MGIVLVDSPVKSSDDAIMIKLSLHLQGIFFVQKKYSLESASGEEKHIVFYNSLNSKSLQIDLFNTENLSYLLIYPVGFFS